MNKIQYAIDKERAILVGVKLPYIGEEKIEEFLSELEALSYTAGAEVINKFIQKRDKIDPAYFIGKGFALKLKEFIESHNINLVIFDDDLTPSQTTNLEDIFNVKVIDRTGLILDIFAMHARTNIAKIQVELAQLEYLLPRLVGRGKEFMQQQGGIGTRGPGETKLEVDRRRIKKRISDLKKKLKEIEKTRIIQRQKRDNLFKISIVGYTNVGKSSLLNLLSHSDVLVENKLFATLDATTRKVKLPDDSYALFTDTVGFIRKLPHSLVESFKSTLEVTKEADLILVLIDGSASNINDQIKVVKNTLKEIGVDNTIKMLYVFNKIDKLSEEDLIVLENKYKDAVFISVKQKINIDKLLDKIVELKNLYYESIFVTYNYDFYKYLESNKDRFDAVSIVEKEGELFIYIKYKKELKEYILNIIDKWEVRVDQ